MSNSTITNVKLANEAINGKGSEKNKLTTGIESVPPQQGTDKEENDNDEGGIFLQIHQILILTKLLMERMALKKEKRSW